MTQRLKALMPWMCIGTLTAIFGFCQPELASGRSSQGASPTVPAKRDHRLVYNVGDPVEDFTLSDFRGKPVSLSDYAEKRLVVLAFMGTECPLAKLYAPRLQELSQAYKDKDVAFLAIGSNSHDALTEIGAFVRRHQLTFPFLKDLGNVVADDLGAERTPEVFLLDQDRVVRYRGRIDDQYGIGYIRDEPQTRHLADAIEALLADKPVAVAKTDAVGCIIGRVRKADETSTVTYSNQIADVLQRNCVECHRPTQIGPFALTEYDEVAGWSGMIAEVVAEQRMPPWHATEDSLPFSNERRLTEEEKQLIYDWVAAGAPEGNQADLPEPMTFQEGWNLPQAPDDIIYMRDDPYVVPAEGTVQYQYFVYDPGWSEDRWFKAAEVRPLNSAVVHHVLVFARVPGQEDRTGGGLRGFLASYVPGLRAAPYPQGMAKRIPAGSQLVFQVHYTPIGTKQLDRSMVGFVWANEDEVEREVVTTSAFKRRLRIPPNDSNYQAEAVSQPSPKDALLLGFMPHMHLRGKSAFYELRGDTELTLLDIPDYDFNWQTAYRLAEPLPLAEGSRIRAVFHYDNSEDNLNNPDPAKEVRWGDQTWEEMMIAYFDVSVPRDPKREESANPDAKAKEAKMRKQAEKQADEMIARFDTDQDGRIGFDELPAQFKQGITRFDSNGDKIVSREELVNLLMIFSR